MGVKISVESADTRDDGDDVEVDKKELMKYLKRGGKG